MASSLEAEGCERLGKILFLHVDPTIRQLLALLKRQQELTVNHVLLVDEEEILGMLRQESDLLEKLQLEIVGFPQSKFAKEIIGDNDSLYAASLAMLLDYITLPIVAILRRHPAKEKAIMNAETDRRKIQIRTSAERKSQAIAARILRHCLEIIAPSLDQTKRNNLLLACATALPTGRELSDQLFGVGLDSGDYYMESVLATIGCLLQTGATNDDELAMEGDLLAHIADVCIATVAPPSRFVASTMLQALRTLEQLMEASPLPSVWRSLFPGLFAVSFYAVLFGKNTDRRQLTKLCL